MKPRLPLSELALMLQEARRRNPAAYTLIAALAGMSERRVKDIAYGAEPTMAEKLILEVQARG